MPQHKPDYLSIWLQSGYGPTDCCWQHGLAVDKRDVKYVKQKKPSLEGFLMVTFQQLRLGGEYAIGAEHRFDTTYRLADTVLIFDQGKAHVSVAVVAETNAR